jgi:quercetin 2,3-dioxygenase
MGLNDAIKIMRFCMGVAALRYIPMHRGASACHQEHIRMMIFRPSNERGHAQHGWLDSYHSFSFAAYADPAHMGWGNLRVINEDRIIRGAGFGTHGHQDMEIVSYVLSGALGHRDSMGTVSTMVAGDVQRMTAGTGVRHSEMNAGQDSAHFLQIWLLPSSQGLAPSYAQQHFEAQDKRGRLLLVADGRDRDTVALTNGPGALSGTPPKAPIALNADARLYAGLLDADAPTAALSLDPARKAYVFLIRGQLKANGHALQAGDALSLAHEQHLALTEAVDAEVLVFDLAS